MPDDYLPKEWENRLGQAINLANTIRRATSGDPTMIIEACEDNEHTRRVVEQLSDTGQRSEATWKMAIKIAKEVE